MQDVILVLTAFAAIALAAQLLSCAIAAVRCRKSVPVPQLDEYPPVTLIRPVCGLDFGARETLGSTFRLDWPRFEVLFCVADARDPAIGLIEALIRAHPHIEARLLIGRSVFAANPKLDNCAKGYAAASHDWVVMTDSNLLLPKDYLHRVIGADAPGVGLVSAPPVGGEAEGFWAEVEACVLNSFQARVQYTVDAFRLGFAQGKTLAFRRSMLDRAGGYAALAQEPAEDAAATRAVRRLGLRVKLARPPFVQLLGRRAMRAVWQRQVRWARLRRATFPWLYAPEVLAGPILPLASVAAIAHFQGDPVVTACTLYLAAWYAGEAMLAMVAGWRFTPLSLAAFVVRDAALPAIWIAGFAGRSFAWRGSTISIDAPLAGEDKVLPS